MKVNSCNELEFELHLAKALIEFEEKNKIYRWKMVADLERFGGKNIQINNIKIPLITSEYDEKELNLLKNECDFAPRILDININNYEGTISIICDKTNKIEWFDENLNLLDTKYNFGGRFYTSFSVKNLCCTFITFKLIGEYGEKVSKKFKLIEYK